MAKNKQTTNGNQQQSQQQKGHTLLSGLVLPVLKIFTGGTKEVDEAKQSRDSARELYTNTKKGLTAQLGEAKALVKTHRTFNKAKRELIKLLASAQRSDASLAVDERKGQLMTELIDHSKDVRVQAAENKALAARELITQKVLGERVGGGSSQPTKSLPWKG